MSRARAGLVTMLVLALGCPRATPELVVPDDRDATGPEHAEPTMPAACGDGSTVIAEPARTLPELATTTALLELDDPGFDAALAQLASHARSEGNDLPVRTAFSIAQWGWEVPLVREAFAREGFVAAELAAAHFDDAPPLWILPLGCELERAIARLEADHGLVLRDLGDAAIASPVAGSRFPFDVVVRADAIALVAAGRARVALAAWRREPLPGGLTAPSPGSVLAQIERAPIRLLVRPTGLLGPEAPSTSATERGYRALADGVVAIDAPDP
jgi:hypothetical protein